MQPTASPAPTHLCAQPLCWALSYLQPCWPRALHPVKTAHQRLPTKSLHNQRAALATPKNRAGPPKSLPWLPPTPGHRCGLPGARPGGTAIDAAIAVQMVLRPGEAGQSSGIGGGAFLLYAAGSKVEPMTGAKPPPRRHREPVFKSRWQAHRWPSTRLWWAGAAWATPGAVRMLELAHQEHGKLRLGQLAGASRDYSAGRARLQSQSAPAHFAGQ